MYIRDHETIGDELTNIFSQIHVLPRLSVMRRGYAVVLLTLAESDGPKPITQRNSEINWLCGAANRIRTCDPVITNTAIDKYHRYINMLFEGILSVMHL